MSYPHLIKRHFSFNKSERRSWILTSAITSLIVFFFIWRTTSFGIETGLLHIMILFILTLISIGFLITSAKIIAITKRYTVEYKSWLNGLLVTFVVSFVSYGILPLFFPGELEAKIIERQRHGRVFPGENKSEMSFILTMTIICMVILTSILSVITKATGFFVFEYFLLINGLITLFIILPTPHNIGLHLFYFNRKRFYFMFFFVIIFLIAILMKSSYAILIALLCAIIFYKLATNKKFNPLEKEYKDL